MFLSSYDKWLVESGLNRDMTQPTMIEFEAGNMKVYADPDTENWIGETSRIEMYKDILSELKDSLKEKDEAKIKSILSDIRDTPLFAQDTSNVWKTTQIDGPIVRGSNGDDVKWAAQYAVRKIQLFLEWTQSNQ